MTAVYSPSEHVEQSQVISWCNNMAHGYPEFKRVLAIPNGQSKDRKTAQYFKSEGLRSGVPDLFWPLVTTAHPGLFIEMKRRKGGAVSATQKDWIAWLKSQGYRVEVCKGSTEAIRVLSEYWEEYK